MNLQELRELLWGRAGGPGRQVKLWWLIGLAALGAMLMILSGTDGNRENSLPAQATGHQPAVVQTAAAQDGTAAMENRLQAVLAQVAGAGKVEVEIHLADAGQTDYANNVTTDKKTSSARDGNGTTSVTTDDSETDQVVMNQSGGQDSGAPVVTRRLAPQVNGVLIIAAGAGNPSVRSALTEAAAVALHVPSYEVLVLPGGGE